MRSEFSIEILSKYIEQHTLQCAYCTSCFHDSLIEMIITECIFQNLYSKYVGMNIAYVYSYTELARGLQRAIAANAVPQHIIEEIIELEIASL
jgi:aerobic-type carbon monoxide dehydrogenase small subunit (CoxS/CutS family)